MNRKSVIVLIVSLVLTINCKISKADSLKDWEIQKVLIDYHESPIDVSNASPGISWILTSSKNNQMQLAYQILVATSKELLNSGKADIWDSGRKKSSQSSNIRLNGKTLMSNTDYWMKLTSWNENGKSAVKIVAFSTAYLNPSDWKANWIGAESEYPFTWEKASIEQRRAFNPDSLVANRSQLLRKEISIRKVIKRARVFASGLGLYELSINGQKIGDHVLSPAQTRYSDRVLYEVFDVKDKLREGTNAIGLQVGNGFYNPIKKYLDWRMDFWGFPRAILQLEIEYEDGSKETVLSDKTWKVCYGPVIENSIYDGEHYDARLEQKGWNEPNFHDKSWKSVTIMQKPTKVMQAQTMAPQRVLKVMKVVNVWKIDENSSVYNIGQNLTGWTAIKLKGEKGSKVSIRYGEDINTDHTLNAKSNRHALNTDVYILKGEGVEYYEPRFTYHGYQYFEVTKEKNVQILDVEPKMVATDLPQNSFETDNPTINNIQNAIAWTQKSAMQGIPIPCTQRDERVAWLADAYVTADEAMLNFFAPDFYSKWLADIRLTQDTNGALPYVSPRRSQKEATNWSCGYFWTIWDHYNNYGDKELLSSNYKAMQDYVTFLKNGSNNLIVKPDRYGDWLTPAQNDKDSGWKRGNPELSTTAMFYMCTAILEKTAKVLMKTTDAGKYGQLKEEIKTAFNKKYFDTKTANYKSESYDYQYVQAMPLYLGLTPDSLRERALDNLIYNIKVKRNGHFYAGILGVKYLYEMLMQQNRNDITYEMVTAKGYPGYDDMLQGRNTLTETWGGGGSHNQAMFGSIGAWFYRSLAGINTDSNAVGYERILIKPFFPEGGVNKVSAQLETQKGTIKSSWVKNNNEVSMELTIPANAKSVIYLPAVSAIVINGKVNNNSEKGIVLGSGTYSLQFKI
nr:family 78 glycoside hydrolase catalytic domain [uncultured Pedobacter sp.]